MQYEQLIWEYLDNPNDTNLQSRINELAEKDPSILESIEQCKIIHQDLKMVSLDTLNPVFSEEMEANIINQLPISKGENWSDLQFWSFIIFSIVAAGIAFTYLTGQEASVNNWVSNWQNAAPKFNDLQNINLNTNIEIHWNFYLILVIPFVLYFMDQVFMNNIKLSKNTNLLL